MTPRISRRAFLGVTGLITGAAAIPGLTPARVLAQSEKPGGLLRVSVTFGLSTINPIMHISGAEWMATKWMYNNLTRLNAKREPVPDRSRPRTLSPPSPRCSIRRRRRRTAVRSALSTGWRRSTSRRCASR